MPTFAEAIDIPSASADVFALCVDVARRGEWDPTTKGFELLDGATEFVEGVHVTLDAKSGPSIEGEISEVVAPEMFSISMTMGPWYLYHYSLKWQFHGPTPERTHVILRCRVRSWPALLRVVIEPILCWRLQRAMRNRLYGLRAHFALLNPPAPRPPPEPLPPELRRRQSRRR